MLQPHIHLVSGIISGENNALVVVIIFHRSGKSIVTVMDERISAIGPLEQVGNPNPIPIRVIVVTIEECECFLSSYAHFRADSGKCIAFDSLVAVIYFSCFKEDRLGSFLNLHGTGNRLGGVVGTTPTIMHFDGLTCFGGIHRNRGGFSFGQIALGGHGVRISYRYRQGEGV